MQHLVAYTAIFVAGVNIGQLYWGGIMRSTVLGAYALTAALIALAVYLLAQGRWPR